MYQNHPVTGIPCFWVHPCNTAEAMRSITNGIEKQVTSLEYLMVWIGLVAAAVGLSLPKELVVGEPAPKAEDHEH